MLEHGFIFESTLNHISLQDVLPRPRGRELQKDWNMCIIFVYHYKIINKHIKKHMYWLLEERTK